MQKMIEQAGPSIQLFETVNFAFMKNFDFLVKIAIFWAFLLFLGWFMSQITAEIELGGYTTVFKFPRNKQRKIAKAHTVHFQT
jgi:hypothetical protein